MRPSFDLSPTSKGRVIVSTALLTMVFIILAFAVDSFNWPNLDAQGRLRHTLINMFVPLLVSAPIMYFLMNKQRELAIAHDALQVIASTDSLTTVLNRGAFTALVEAYLTRVADEQMHCALLVIDADNFKSINDNFGHDHGDEALRIIAGAIKQIVRGDDIVGRIGGEEFGVFLTGSSANQAQMVAERIRSTINQASFAPGGARRPLSVSVGGAVFRRRMPFNELFRIADQQLYAAKEKGRNRVVVAEVDRYDPVPMAAA
jgi:diguanylate cyclase